MLLGNSARHIPLYQYLTIDELCENIPYSCPLIGIEMGGNSINNFIHPERSIYLLGAEDHGIPKKELEQCHYVIELPAERAKSFNVAVAGSIVMYDRYIKNGRKAK